MRGISPGAIRGSASKLSAVIKTEAEYRRTMQAFKVLMEKDEAAMTEEEGRMLELLAILLEDYEDREYPLPKAKPHKMLARRSD